MASVASLLSHLLESVAEAAALIALAWVCVFGGVGAVLAYTRDQQPALGVLLGCVAGPIGWWVICERGKEDEEEDFLSDDWSTL